MSQWRTMESLHACPPGEAQNELASQFGVEYRVTASLEWSLYPSSREGRSRNET